MKTYLFTSLIALGFTISLVMAAPDPATIIKKVDDIRNPSASYRMVVSVESGDVSSPEKSAFEVSIQGNTKTYVKTLEPARDRGRNLLMLEEDMWAYIPNLKRSVRVSLSQKLSGQAANGDISRMRWSGDYDATLENDTKDHWIVFLKAKKKGLTYDQVRVWVDPKTNRPEKAEYLTPAGKPLKTAKFSDYKTLAGQIRPSMIEIEDAVKKDDRSVLKIESMETTEFPASLFNPNSFK